MPHLQKISRSLFKKVFSSWVTYIFILCYWYAPFAFALSLVRSELTPRLCDRSTWTWSQNANSWITLFLKSVKNADGTKRFTVSELNAIPIGGCRSSPALLVNCSNQRADSRSSRPSSDVLQIVVMLAIAWLSDRKGWRASLVIVQEVTLLIGAIILSVWPASFGLKMFGFYILYLSCAGGPILVAWMADLTPCPSQRALILGLTPTCSFAIDSFANSAPLATRAAFRYLSLPRRC